MTDLKEQIGGEGKKDKMEISYFLFLLGGGQRKECEISSGCSSDVRV